MLLGVSPVFASGSSVYEVEPTRDIALTSVALGIGGGAYLFAKDWIRPSCPCDPNAINSWDRIAIGNNSSLARGLSDLGVGVAFLAFPVFDFMDLGFSSPLFEDAVVFSKSMAVSFALVSLSKHFIQRPIPRVVSGQSPELIQDPQGYRSFYSAHTALAFTALSAGAMTLQYRYHFGVWPWVITGALGTGVAVARVLGGAHYPSDVLVGAAMGVLTGITIPWLHRRKDQVENAVFLLPTRMGGLQWVIVKAW